MWATGSDVGNRQRLRSWLSSQQGPRPQAVPCSWGGCAVRAHRPGPLPRSPAQDLAPAAIPHSLQVCLSQAVHHAVGLLVVQLCRGRRGGPCSGATTS